MSLPPDPGALDSASQSSLSASSELLSNHTLFTCKLCSELLDEPIATLPCGFSIHKSCIPTDSQAPNTFTCPFPNCRTKSHCVDDYRNDLILSKVLHRWKEIEGLEPSTTEKGKDKDDAPSLDSSIPAPHDKFDSSNVGNELSHSPEEILPMEMILSSTLSKKRRHSACQTPNSELVKPPDAEKLSDSPSKVQKQTQDQSCRFPIQKIYNSLRSMVPQCNSSITSSTSELVLNPASDLKYEDFEEVLECQLCYNLLYEPITVSKCGHTSCKPCLLRTLDHNDKCFYCRAHLGRYIDYHDHPVNFTLSQFISRNFAEQFSSRQEVMRLEIQSQFDEVPIFVCSLNFPGIPCYLHIFEPRYRLMMRRVTAPGANRMFGMCLPCFRGGMVDYGTMMKIGKIEFMQDGRSLVETTGVWRFKVLERGVKDGYCVAKIQKIEDIDSVGLDEPLHLFDESMAPSTVNRSSGNNSSTSESQTASENSTSSPSDTRSITIRDLLSSTNTFLTNFLAGLPQSAQSQFLSNYGTMPTDIGLWTFWLANLLPVHEYERYSLLGIRSVRERLRIVLHWVDIVRKSREGPCPALRQTLAGSDNSSSLREFCTIM